MFSSAIARVGAYLLLSTLLRGAVGDCGQLMITLNTQPDKYGTPPATGLRSENR